MLRKSHEISPQERDLLMGIVVQNTALGCPSFF